MSRSSCTDGTNKWVHLINLSTLVDTKVNEPLDSGTIGGLDGTWAVAYAADGSLLVTSQYDGSGFVPLLRLINGQWSTVSNDVQQDTMVSASGDGQVVSLAESNISDGRSGLITCSPAILSNAPATRMALPGSTTR